MISNCQVRYARPTLRGATATTTNERTSCNARGACVGQPVSTAAGQALLSTCPHAQTGGIRTEQTHTPVAAAAQGSMDANSCSETRSLALTNQSHIER